VCAPARGGLHRSQALWGDAELELDFHEDGAWWWGRQSLPVKD
jgi:hypothetical protein